MKRFSSILFLFTLLLVGATVTFGGDHAFTIIPGLLLMGVVLPAGWPGKASYDTTQPGGEHAEDVSPIVQILSPTETPLLNALGMGMKPATNVRHEWLEDELIPDSTSLPGGINAAQTTIAVTDASIFQAGELVSIGQLPYNELVMVQTVNEAANTIVVTRGYGATTALAHASGTSITLMGEVSLEGADAPVPQKSAMDRPYNITHIFNYGLGITGTREAMMPYLLHDHKDEWAYETMKRITEAMRDLEASVVGSDFTFAGGVPTIGGTNQVRTMRGIVNFMRFGVYIGGVLTAPPAACYRNAAAVSFTYDNFRSLQQQVVYNFGARNANLLLIPPSLKVSVAKWKRAVQQIVVANTTMENTRIAEVVGEITSDYGNVTVIMDPRLAQYGNVSILLSRDLVKPMNLVSRSFFIKDIAPTGDATKKELIGEYTLEMKGVSKGHHSLVYNWAAI